jgi:hypothetical protein
MAIGYQLSAVSYQLSGENRYWVLAVGFWLNPTNL